MIYTFDWYEKRGSLHWSFFEIFAPDSQIFFYLNFLWPLAGFFMIVTGIVVLRAKKLKGWKRYTPFLAGLWFPQTTLMYLIDPNSMAELAISGTYATIVFSLLGFVLVTSEDETTIRNKVLYKS